MRNRRGFTLIEIMIVVAIMAVIGLFSVPAYQQFQALSRLKGASRQVMTDLMAARMQAVSDNAWIAVNIDSDHAYTIYRDNDKNGSVSGGDVTLAVKDIHPTYTGVTITSGVGGVVIFYPNGTGSTATLVFTGTAGTRTLTVSAAGRVRIS